MASKASQIGKAVSVPHRSDAVLGGAGVLDLEACEACGQIPREYGYECGYFPGVFAVECQTRSCPVQLLCNGHTQEEARQAWNEEQEARALDQMRHPPIHSDAGVMRWSSTTREYRRMLPGEVLR